MGGEDEGEGEELQPLGPAQGDGEERNHTQLQEDGLEHGAGERALALGVPGDEGEGWRVVALTFGLP